MNILAVCLGNICRSPLAEGILKQLTRNHALEMCIDSAGTSAFHIGERPCTGSIDIAHKNNIDISYYSARQFLKEDFNRFDLILAMDTSNYNDLLYLARNNEDKDKIEMVLNYIYPGENRSVPDSYYTGNYEEVFSLLYKACSQLVTQLNHEKK